MKWIIASHIGNVLLTFIEQGSIDSRLVLKSSHSLDSISFMILLHHPPLSLSLWEIASCGSDKCNTSTVSKDGWNDLCIKSQCHLTQKKITSNLAFWGISLVIWLHAIVKIFLFLFLFMLLNYAFNENVCIFLQKISTIHANFNH